VKLLDDPESVRGYIASSLVHAHLADRFPGLTGPLTAPPGNALFVAVTPA